MFKLFAKKKDNVKYEVVVIEINSGLEETIIIDNDGVKTLAMNGYDIVKMREI